MPVRAPAVSVLVPAYNEVDLLPRSLARLAAVPDFEPEVVVIDDGSTDGTAALRESILSEGLADQWLTHPTNRGKGAAVRSGLAHVRAAVVAIQDADLEYDPAQLPLLAAPVLAGEEDVVLGSRQLGVPVYGMPMPTSALELVWFIGSEVINLSASLVCRRRLTDVETCQKVIRTDLFRSLDLREERFGIEVEVVLKLVRGGARIREMGIPYQSRSWAAGKKIGYRDGFEALACVLRYGLGRR